MVSRKRPNTIEIRLRNIGFEQVGQGKNLYKRDRFYVRQIITDDKKSACAYCDGYTRLHIVKTMLEIVTYLENLNESK